MDPVFERNLLLTRRTFFGDSGLKLGGLALALMGAQGAAQAAATSSSQPAGGSGAARVHPALPGLPHFKPKAKAMIYLHMNGAPSQLDLWDHKPKLGEYFDKDLPPSVRNNQRLSTMTSGQARFPVAPSMFKFTQHGKCGRYINAELLPHTAKIVDDIAVIKTVNTNAINHDPACTFVMTGNEIPGYASLGSWLAYGLGSENNDLPAFVAMTPRFPDGSNGQALFSRMWASGFLPTRFGGVTLRNVGDPVLYLPNPAGVDTEQRRTMLDALGKLNQRGFERLGDPEIQARISQYEMAFRMQRSVPELTDLSNEPKHVRELYGPDIDRQGSFAHSALLARRLIERGVRVVQLFHRGWDQHGGLPKQLGNQCKDSDQGTAALVLDLKQRGLLDETLIVWGGEFGRTVYSQGTLTKDNYGRDHHPRNFCMWMAGGGIKGGIEYGKTDDFSYNVAENPVSINELNATILRCMGIDHNKLTYKFQGLDAKVTGVEPVEPVKALLA